jgi:hypothetical protein
MQLHMNFKINAEEKIIFELGVQLLYIYNCYNL